MTDARGLTDVQLVHRLDAALAAREAAGEARPPSRAEAMFRALPPATHRLAPLVILAALLRDTLAGLRLALAGASHGRLKAWAEASDATIDAIVDDARIMRLMHEAERRVRARSPAAMVLPAAAQPSPKG